MMGVLWSDTQPPLTLFVSFLIIISAHLTTFTIIISAPPDLHKSLFGLLRTYFFKSSPSLWSYPQNTDPGDPTAVSHFCQGLDHLQFKFSLSLCCHSHKIYLGCFLQMCWRWFLYEHCSGGSLCLYICVCLRCCGWLSSSAVNTSVSWFLEEWYLLTGRDPVGRWSCPRGRPACFCTGGCGELCSEPHTHTHTVKKL